MEVEGHNQVYVALHVVCVVNPQCHCSFVGVESTAVLGERFGNNKMKTKKCLLMSAGGKTPHFGESHILNPC